jgi:hypothetical protein
LKNRGLQADIEIKTSDENINIEKIRDMEMDISKFKIKVDLRTKEKIVRKELLNIKIDQMTDLMNNLEISLSDLKE